jgi:hypothetical protein
MRVLLRLSIILALLPALPVHADEDCNSGIHREAKLEALPPEIAPEVATALKSRHHARLAGDLVDATRLEQDIEILSGERPLGGSGLRLNDRATPENRKRALEFLDSRLRELGYATTREDFEADLVSEKKKVKGPDGERVPKVTHFTGTNVFAEIRGTKAPQEIVEINAHYDTYSRNVPGADDNGSGLATLLEIARLFRGFSPERTIRFVFADLEERGFFGTEAHAKMAAARGDKIVGAIVVDMIGYYPSEAEEAPHFVMELGTKSQFGKAKEAYRLTRAMANEIAFQYASYGDRRTRLHPVTYGSLPYTGDHGAYWRENYPAVLIAAPYKEGYVNPGYHKPTDQSRAINWNYLSDISRLVAEGLACFAGATACDGDLQQALGERDWYWNQRASGVSRETDLLPPGSGQSKKSGDH